MRKPNRLTLEGHAELAARLAEARDALVAASLIARRGYPIPVAERLYPIMQAIDRLAAHFDSRREYEQRTGRRARIAT